MVAARRRWFAYLSTFYGRRLPQNYMANLTLYRGQCKM